MLKRMVITMEELGTAIKALEKAYENKDPAALKQALLKVNRCVGEDVDAIPLPQRRAIGILYVQAIAETNPNEKANSTEGVLNLVRGGMLLARYPNKTIAEVDTYIKNIMTIRGNIDRSEVQFMSTLYNESQRALVYLSPLIWGDGLGIIDVETAFTKRTHDTAPTQEGGNNDRS